MNKLIATGFAFALTAASFGADVAALQFFVKPGSAKGFVAVVNKQTKVDEKEFATAIENIRKDRPFTFRIVKDESAAKDAAAVIRIIDEAGKPPMTVSPEVSRGEMNVAVLVDDIKSDAGKKKFFVSRARRVLMRTVAYTLGAGGTRYSGNIMSSIRLRDLDLCNEALPADTLEALAQNAARLGLTPEYKVPYEIACEEGWAPEPVTEEQKKIWKEVRSIPTAPIKVKFDPKKGE